MNDESHFHLYLKQSFVTYLFFGIFLARGGPLSSYGFNILVDVSQHKD